MNNAKNLVNRVRTLKKENKTDKLVAKLTERKREYPN
jgi:hypothetical protein